MLEEKGSEFKIAKVDCEVERRACSRFAIANYPSLFLVKDDHVYLYKHGRSLKAYVSSSCGDSCRHG